MILGQPGETLHLSWQSKLGETTLYPQAKIYDNAETLLATVNLTHRQDGLYTSTTSIGDEGVYTAQYIAYTDSGHTAQSGVDEIISETISIQRSWRPTILNTNDLGGISEKELDPLVKGMTLLAEEMAKIKKELDKKSEFNPSSDKVKTDFQPTSLRPILEKMDNIKIKVPQVNIDSSKIIKAIEKNKPKETDLTPVISAIKNQKFPIPKVIIPNTTEKMLEVMHKNSVKRDIVVRGLINKLMIMIKPFLKINNILERFNGKKNTD